MNILRELEGKSELIEHSIYKRGTYGIRLLVPKIKRNTLSAISALATHIGTIDSLLGHRTCSFVPYLTFYTVTFIITV